MIHQRKKLGSSGEDIAVSYLIKKNYKILDRNVELKFGEIDIIASDGDYIVLIEVKTKKQFTQGSAEEMVDFFKQKKLRLLSQIIQQKYPNKSIRIDVIAINIVDNNFKINHLVNAVEGK